MHSKFRACCLAFIINESDLLTESHRDFIPSDKYDGIATLLVPAQAAPFDETYLSLLSCSLVAQPPLISNNYLHWLFHVQVASEDNSRSMRAQLLNAVVDLVGSERGPGIF